METTTLEFVKYENNILSTVCHIYKHEDGRILHLLPIVHTGDKKYYEEMMTYIGEKICIYENIVVGSHEGRENADDLLTALNSLEHIANVMDETSKRSIRKLRRKYITGELRKVRRMVKKRVKQVDEKVELMFNQCERTGYDMRNLFTISASLAEILGLTYQMFEIDYIGDIPNRQNFCHADLIKDEPAGNFEEEEEIVFSPNPENVEEYQKRALILYVLLSSMVDFLLIPVKEGRDEFAQSIVLGLTSEFKETQQIMPDFIFTERNQIILDKIDELYREHNELVVFYGAGHMKEIAQIAIKSKFQLEFTQDFIVFNAIEYEEQAE